MSSRGPKAKKNFLRSARPLAKEKSDVPPHLKQDGRRLWHSITTEWILEPHALELLTLACETLDRLHEAREEIAKAGSGYFVSESGRPQPHPALRTERDCRILFARLWRELGFDTAEKDSRPPPIGGWRRR